MPDYRFQINKQFQEIMKQNAEYMAKVYEPMLKFQNPPVIEELQETIRGFTKIADEISFKNQEIFRHIENLTKNTGFKAYSDYMELVGKQFQTNFDHLISPQISKVLANIDYQSISNEDFPDYLAKDFIPIVYEELEKEAKDLNTGHASIQSLYFKLNVLMFLISAFLTIWLDRSNKNIQASNEHDHKKTHDLVEKLTAKTDSLEEELKSNSSILLLAKKSAPVRNAPNSASDTLITVFEGQYLDLIDEIKFWYQVQYFNFKEDSLGTGWIYKGHVEEIRGE